jgi:hypothetical protein
MKDNNSEDPESEAGKPDDLYGEVVFRITRRQLMEEGTLLDISTTAREAGIIFPVAITAGLWAAYGDAESPDASVGFVWDLCWMLRCAVRGAIPCRKFKNELSETRFFQLIVKLRATGDSKLAEVKAVCGPGDEMEPVITILLPEED